MIKTPTTASLDEQIAALEAEIETLQQRFKRYGPIMPGRPGQPTGAGPYDPTLFLQKNAVALDIDRKQIELANLKRQQAEQELAAYNASEVLPHAEATYQEAETALVEAKRALQAAQGEYDAARYSLDNQRERHTRLTRTVAQHDADAKRWSAELERDRIRRSDAGGDDGKVA